MKQPGEQAKRSGGQARQLAVSLLLTVCFFALVLLGTVGTVAFVYNEASAYSAALFGAIVILGFTALITWQLFRLRHYATGSEKLLGKINSAAEHSLDALYLLRGERSADGEIVDFVFTSVNRRGAEMLALPATKVLGQRLSSLLPQHLLNGQFEKYLKVIRGDKSLEEEFENTAPELQGHWFRQQLVPIGDLKSLLVFIRDITDHKRLEIKVNNSRAFLQSLIDHLPLLVYTRDMRREGRMLIWNKTAELVTGYATGNVINNDDADVFPAKIVEMFSQLDQKMLTDPMVVDVPEVEFQRADGGSHYLRMISVPLFDENDELEHILGIAEDITGQRKQALALRMKQAELIAANDASPLGLFRTDEDGQWTYVNRTYEDISGLDKTQSLGDGWAMAIHPDDRAGIFQAWRKSLLAHQPYEGIYRLQHADGRVIWISTKTAPIIVDGELHGYVGSVDDITTRREAEQALSKSEQRLRTITDTLPALVAYVDADERYRVNNLAYERTYGVSRDDIKHQTIREFLGEEEYRAIKPYIERVLCGEIVKFEQNKRIAGMSIWSESDFIPQFAEDGKSVVGFHVMTQDITSKKLEERRLVQLAQIDSLTGLVNRAGFEQKLLSAMTKSRTNGSLMALMYLDIDHFKKINDTRGHVVGDVLLKVFSGRLQRTVRAIDTVCRLGGDEFSIIVEEITQPEIAENIAAKIVHAMQSQFSLEGELVPVTASIGVAFYRGEALEAKILIKRADEMLYQAKAIGRNTYCIAKPELK